MDYFKPLTLEEEFGKKKKKKERKTGEAAEENKRKLSKAPALQLKPCKGWKLLIFRAKKKNHLYSWLCFGRLLGHGYYYYGLTLNLFFRSQFANFGLKKLCIFLDTTFTACASSVLE